MTGKLTPGERSDSARYAALVRHSRGDTKAATEPARRAWELRLERQVVDPDEKLDPDGPEYAAARDDIPDLADRIRRLRSAHMAWVRRQRGKNPPPLPATLRSRSAVR